jgi:RNA polymerase sigma-70 factor (ECF subfamily)
MSNPNDLATEFERHRPYMRAIALRMLGSADDADDAVQEAWLRLDRTGADDIGDVRAWLTTVTSRVCLDLLRTRRTRAELPTEIDLDEILIDAEASPENDAVLAESIGVALHVVMDQLNPAERVAFVLHDVFGFSFRQIGDVLDRSTDAAKMLASRARRRVRLVAPQTPGRDDRALLDSFLAAARSGDLDRLIAMLAPDIELRAVTPEAITVVRGADAVAARASFGARQGAKQPPTFYPITVQGAAAVLIVIDDRPTSVLAIRGAAGRIAHITTINDPAKLAQLVPSWVTSRRS